MIPKKKSKWIYLLSVLVAIILITVMCFIIRGKQYKLSSLTFFIAQESSWNNGIYAESYYKNYVSKSLYYELNAFKYHTGSLDSVNVSSFTITMPKVNVFPFAVTASYEYDCTYYDLESDSSHELHGMCQLIWKYVHDNWEIVSYREEKLDDLPQNICQHALTELTYKIAQESCWTCAKYDRSQYLELISENNYKKMSVFHNLNGKVNCSDIEYFGIYNFEFHTVDVNTTVVNYVLIDDFGWNNFTVVWSLQDDGSWRITDVDDDR